MIIFNDGTLGSLADSEESKAVYEFFDQNREWKNHFHFWSGVSQANGNAHMAHMVDHLESTYFSYGSVVHDQSGRLIHCFQPWMVSTADIEDENELKIMEERAKLIDLGGKWRAVSKYDYGNWGKRNPDELWDFHGAVASFYIFGPGENGEEALKYMEYCQNEKNELALFRDFLRDKGYNAHVSRGCEIDVIHSNHDLGKTFNEGPISKKKANEDVYFLTTDLGQTIFQDQLPAGVKLVGVRSYKDTIEFVKQYTQETER